MEQMQERTYIGKALYVYDEASVYAPQMLEANDFGTRIVPVPVHRLAADPASYCHTEGCHLVLSAGNRFFGELIAIAHRYGCSVGFLPHPEMKRLQKDFGLGNDLRKMLEVALRDDPAAINLLQVNGEFVMGDFLSGTVPLVGSIGSAPKKHGFIVRSLQGTVQFFKTRLQRVDIETANGRKVTTAMSGLFILRHSRNDILARLSTATYSIRDNQLLLVIVSPFSVYEFFTTALSLFSPVRRKSLPKSVGYIKSPAVTIAPGLTTRGRSEDGRKFKAPFVCGIVEEAIRINAPESFWEEHPKVAADKESVKIENLPDENETQRYHGHHIPLFSYASEERFKDLFRQLRDDAKVDNIYVALMLLSTLLATVGLFADSSAVVIGAMLLAPLMAPIVSLAMGLLRADESLLRPSLRKIGIGVVLALGASAFVTWLLPDTPLTDQVRARINPTLLDLGVAILSGIAAAYSKSFKEIIQSLAGVSIAVALVPPLATAGIGIGLGSFGIFFEAFLLFFTNLVGIVLAGALTFYTLGFSNVLKNKRAIAVVTAVMITISFPLYHSYTEIMQKHRIAGILQKERYLVNGKTVIVEAAEVSFEGRRLRLNLELVTRTILDRRDLRALKEKLERRFDRELDIRARVEYLL